MACAIFCTVATEAAVNYLAKLIGRQVKFLLCVDNVINDLEDARGALRQENDNMLTRIRQARNRTEVIEKSVRDWVDDVENLLREVDGLVERTSTDINCCQGWVPMCGRRYRLCKQMVKKTEQMRKLIGKNNDIQPFSHLDSLQFRYGLSEDFTYFESRKSAYDGLLEALNDDSLHMIGLYGEGGCGKTTLVNEIGKQAEDQKMFDKVISVTVSQTPNIRAIQGKIADMLKLQLGEESEDGRAQRIWTRLKQMKQVLVIVDDLWSAFELNHIGILLGNVERRRWKILLVTRNEHICTLMDCQKMIPLGPLSKDESWTLFQKLARINDRFCTLLDGVPQEICNECKGVLIAIKTMASSLRGKNSTEWKSTLAKLIDAKAFDDHEGGERNALNCIKLSYDCLQNREAELLFLMCCMFPEDYHIPIEDLTRYADGVFKTYSFQLLRSLVEACLNRLFESSMLIRGSVKMHNLVREAALWIANRSDDCKMLVNVDKPLSTVAEDNRIRDCFAVSSWWFNENPSFCQLHAPNLKMLLVNISADSSLNSLDLFPLTFEGIEGLQVFSLTINYKIVPISFPQSIQLLTNVRTLRLNGLMLGNISFIASLTSLEILDLRRCYFNELPIEMRKLKSLKLLDLSECHISENNYNGALRECSQLKELYALPCYPEANVPNIIIDIDILPKLERFVLTHSYFPKQKIFTELRNSDISRLKGSKKNVLQISETISLVGLHGGCKNIIPDLVGSMNNLSTLHLTCCKEIKCIVDATCDLKEDDLIPRLVDLRLQSLHNLTELCHGSPLQVLHYFEKLELLYIEFCDHLHAIFPRECKLQNLKFLRLSWCMSIEVLFSGSVAQSMQQLEHLEIKHCLALKHIIAASGGEHGGCNTSEEIISFPMKSHVLMPNLRDIEISNCQRLESIFPSSCVKGLARLQNMRISHAPMLQYVFGECDQEQLSSLQYQNHVMLPHLELLKLSDLDNFIWLCPENCKPKWPSQYLGILTIENCPKVIIPSFNLKVGYDQTQHRPNENSPSELQNLGLELNDLRQLYSISLVGRALRQIWNFQVLQSIKVGNCKNMKYFLSMETHTSLPELTSLDIYNCQELEKIVAADEELVQLSNAELYFPNLNNIRVYNCNKLKSLFPFAPVTMLPQLRELYLSKASQLEEVFRRSHGDEILDTMEIVLPNLTKLTLEDLRKFVDICHGCKLRATLLRELNVSNCRNIAPTSSLRNTVVARGRII